MAKKILGLDLGTNSIGWALINEYESLIDAGSRIFPEGVNREKGQEVSKNETRRMARQIRRQLFRRKMRKMMIANLLIKNGMFPNVENLDEALKELYLINELRSFFQLNPYELRARAAKGDPLSLMELGRVFYQFSQRRGYKASLKSSAEEGAIFEGMPELNKPGINFNKEMAEKHGTLGAYLNTVNPLEEKKRNRFIGRDLYIKEFNIIYNNQKKFHPETLTEELFNQLGHEETGLLFFQRQLRSQKSKVGRCILEKDKARCNISHPFFEWSRIYQFINTIVFDGELLNSTDKAIVLELMLNEDKNFDFIKIKKKLKNETVQCNYDDKFKAPGSPFLKHFKKSFGKENWDKLSLLDQEKIWEIKYFANDFDWLKNYCLTKWNLDEKQAELFCKIKLPQGYGSLSRKALYNVLAFSQDGYKYHEAVWLAGVKNAFGKKWDSLDTSNKDFVLSNASEILNNANFNSLNAVTEWLKKDFDLTEKELKKLYHHSDLNLPDGKKEELPLFTQNIRNPMVQQTISELRKVVNAIIKEYGKPDEIRVEMARELKMPSSERKELNSKQQKNEERNASIKEELLRYKKPTTGHFVTKLKLFKELEKEVGTAICPYTGKGIGIANLFDDNYVQIEHIIPYSISLDDSFANKTLCLATENQSKGDRTPFQFYGNDKMNWAALKARAKTVLPYNKYERFVNEKNPALDDFLSRQLNDTRYASRVALNYLMHVCSNVRVSRGELTAKLRALWGMNGILTPTYPATKGIDGKPYIACIDKENNLSELVEWDPKNYKKEIERLGKAGTAITGRIHNNRFMPDKQRDDHRHHALDAVVIGCSNTAYLQELSKLHGRISHQEKLRAAFQVEVPWDTFYNDVNKKIRSILVSYRKRNKAITPIHKKVDIVVDGKKKTIRSQGLGARGELHKESVYGKYIIKGKESFHIRKGLENFTKVKDLDKVVDDGIREILLERVRNHLSIQNLTPDTVIPADVWFKKETDGKLIPRVYLPNANGPYIPVRKVRIKENFKKAVNWHEGFNQWVDPQNNHHLLIYQTADGALKEQVVSFWDVVERKNQKQATYQLPPDGEKIIEILQINNLFVFPHLAFNENYSDALYRVQKLSERYYTFRKATATQIKDVNEEISIRSFPKWNELTPKKVKIDALGKLTYIG